MVFDRFTCSCGAGASFGNLVAPRGIYIYSCCQDIYISPFSVAEKHIYTYPLSGEEKHIYIDPCSGEEKHTDTDLLFGKEKHKYIPILECTRA